jgi:hypothetical protein
MSGSTYLEAPRVAIQVSGPDRLRWLNGLLTCDVAALTPSRAMYGLFANRLGKIQSDAWLLASADAVWLGVPESVVDHILTELDAHLIMEDAVFERQAACMTLTKGHPQGEEGPVRSSLPTGDFVWGSLPLRCRIEGAGTTVEVASGADAMRVAHGMPLFGRDFDSTMHPHEASLEAVAVSFQKGCYLGQEVVCMVEMRGQASRRLARVQLSPGDAPPAVGAPVRDAQGETVGVLRSAVYDVASASLCGFALLKRKVVETTASLNLEGRAVTVLGAGPA